MKKSSYSGKLVQAFLGLLSVVMLTLPCEASPSKAMTNAELKQMAANLHWLGHDAFRIDAGGRTIYIDPLMLKADAPKADLILITHDHFDHLSPDDIAKISKPETIIVTVAQEREKIKGNDVRIIKPGDKWTIKGIGITAIAAYNINKFKNPGVPFHPKASGYVGYIVTVNGLAIYHAGDTDFIPEMNGLAPDIALLPVSGIYVMTADEAAQAATAMKPKVAIPMHVGGPVGVMKSAEDFKAKAKVPVIILPIEK